MSISMRDLFSRQEIPGEIISLRNSLLYHFGDATISLREAHKYLSPEMLVPGLVFGLRHNMNQERDRINGEYTVLFSASVKASVLRHMDGGDLGAPLHRGYEWWMVRDNSQSDPASWIGKLPPGIVLGLKHSTNQANARITVFGRDPVSSSNFPGFRRESGGDLGASSGQGYYWYETTGQGFSDWSLVNKLPRWTVLGLKHSRNQRNKKVLWMGREYDPANSSITPPPGFTRRIGGDRNGGSGEGYYWYEKVTGPEIVIKPTLTVQLERSLLFGSVDAPEQDKDRDGLIDTLEGLLAYAFRPYVIFDSAENARQSHEPVPLFQVRKLNSGTRIIRIGIKWVFLFRQDGGYGPNSLCRDAHGGDTDDALYELESRDGGVTWTLVRVSLSSRGSSFKGPEWPKNSRLEVYGFTHPIIYMSASKHHEYLNRDYDHRNSLYTSSIARCNDDINGEGARFLVNISSLEKNRGYYNNVGEHSASTLR